MNASSKKAIQIASLLVFFLLILVYAFFRSNDLIFGVRIKNVNITDDMKATESIQKIIGNAKNAIKLTINGREISIDEAGNFNETIALLPGYNIINITARDKFEDTDEKNYNVIY